MTNHKNISVHNVPIQVWRQIKANAALKGLSVHKYVIEIFKKAVKGE